MGYESKLYVVEKFPHSFHQCSDGIERCWGDVIATFDLCKVYSVSDKLRKCRVTDCYIYADDRNTEILEDCYGEPLTETSIKNAIKIIEKAQKNEPNYRRWEPCLQMLKGFDESQWKDLVVLHYGY